MSLWLCYARREAERGIGPVVSGNQVVAQL